MNITNYAKTEIQKELVELEKCFGLIKTKYVKPTDMSQYDYIWTIFSYNIFLQAKDLLFLINNHETNKAKIKTSLYLIFRSILEDYFYLKLLTSDKKNIEIHLKAYIASSQTNNKKSLKALLDLESVGMYIPNPDPIHVTSLIGLNKKIEEYEKDIDAIKRNASAAEKRLIDIYSKAISVCKEYDKNNGITKLVKGEEYKSLVWLYDSIYRFMSADVHQVINAKEPVLDLLWHGQSYKGDNMEILSLLSVLLRETRTLFLP